MKTKTQSETPSEVITIDAPENQVSEAVEASKDAKKAPAHRVKLGKVYDTFHTLIPDDAEPDSEGRVTVESVPGVTASFWKTSKEAGDFGGVTLRFDHTAKSYGAGRAILANIHKALQAAGLKSDTIVLRKSGSGAIYV